MTGGRYAVWHCAVSYSLFGYWGLTPISSIPILPLFFWWAAGQPNPGSQLSGRSRRRRKERKGREGKLTTSFVYFFDSWSLGDFIRFLWVLYQQWLKLYNVSSWQRVRNFETCIFEQPPRMFTIGWSCIFSNIILSLLAYIFTFLHVFSKRKVREGSSFCSLQRQHVYYQLMK